MKILQSTDRGVKSYDISCENHDAVQLQVKRIFDQYPSLGYGTMSSGVRWSDMDGLWKVHVSHSLSCD